MKTKITISIISILFIISFKIGAQVPSYIPTNGLIGWWPFNNNANDESGNANHGTIVNAIITSDRFSNNNSAYNFNGTNSLIRINNNFFNIGWQSWTVSCWINSTTLNNPGSGNNNQCIFNTIPLNGFALDFNWGSSNKYALWANSNPSNSNWDVLFNNKSNSNISINTWNHLVVVKNGLNYYLYINGVLDKTITSSITVSSYFAKFSIGNTDISQAIEPFKGTLDDYGIWDTVLTPLQINGIYNATPTNLNENKSTIENINLFPSPIEGQTMSLVFTSKINDKILVQIVDNIGNIVFEHSEIVEIGKNDTQINVENLANGFYYLKIASNGYNKNMKFVKE